MKTISIRRRLLTAYGLTLAFIILLFGAALVWGLNHSFNAQLQSALESVIFDIKHDVLTKQPTTGVLDPDKEYALSPVYIEVWEVRDETPHRVLCSANMKDRHLPLQSEHTGTFSLYSLPFVSKDEQSALLSASVDIGTAHYVISAAAPIDNLDDVIEDFIEMFTIFGFVLYLVALYLGARLINQVLSPMKNITDTAATISHGDLSQRVSLPTVRDEFYTLAQTFNAMLERIEQGFMKMKHFNANVSHELKTPLTILRGEAEVALLKKRDPEAYETVLRSVMEETASMQRIIEGMLLLSRSDQESLEKSMVPVRLDELLQSIIIDQKPLADAKGVLLAVKHLEPAEIKAEPQLLKEALNNLVNNAVKYTPKGKRIAVEMHKTNETVDIAIADEGIGIAKESLSKLFDPFWREDAAHSKALPGHGLGLSIVQWIVHAHHGSIRIESIKGRGTQCYVSFVL